MKQLLFVVAFIVSLSTTSTSQEHSIAREWNEILLESIRNDFARPTVHARNLWHTSVMMYDLWAITHNGSAKPFFLGNTVGGFEFPFEGFSSSNPEEDVRIAICYAMYHLINSRFSGSPGYIDVIQPLIREKMDEENLNRFLTSTDYQSGDPVALGIYIAQQVIDFGYQDGSWEEGDYGNRFYEPVNEPLIMEFSGNPDVLDPNRWQPLTLEFFIDQGGNPQSLSTPNFLGPEWGQVTAFSLTEDDMTPYERDGFTYKVYHDPGPPPLVDLDEKTVSSEEFLWGFNMVSAWSSHLDPADGVMIDISPGASGNQNELPTAFSEYPDFYNYTEGGDPSEGRPLNPHTGQPYEPNMVFRGDYTRVLAEFWADGPESETPPGHWFTLLNGVTDHPELVKKYKGVAQINDDLEWDVKSYFMLGGAMHDCAVTAWGIKGWYDYVRPVSAIRAMAERGQSTIENLPNYHPGGLPLIDGFSEMIVAGDPLAGFTGENIGGVKVYAWKGPQFIDDPETDVAGVGWILAKNWWPYQRPTFVTPNFAGYISGHSTFSRAAAEILTAFTGDEYFPGGVGEFVAEKDNFLVFEKGPSEDVVLQWATYRDASDQTSLSRIWGGIHPPADDIPGRLIGMQIAADVVTLSEQYFFNDLDEDGFYDYVDCDDNNPDINPNIPETCDGIDNNCSGIIDEGLQLYTYFIDEDGDGYGTANTPVDTCRSMPIAGFVDNNLDCNDTDPMVNPDIEETCDGIDNNCSGVIDEGLALFTYYRDEDQDGYGDVNVPVDTCRSMPILGYVINSLDCNDTDADINPDILEICDGVDNDCNGSIDDGLVVYRYYFDQDLDGYGNLAVFQDTCITYSPEGYVPDSLDCNDNDMLINPGVEDIADNGVDEDCTGYDLYKISRIYPNPVSSRMTVHFDSSDPISYRLYDNAGQLVMKQELSYSDNFFEMDLSDLAAGIYYFRIVDEQGEELYTESVFRR